MMSRSGPRISATTGVIVTFHWVDARFEHVQHWVGSGGAAGLPFDPAAVVAGGAVVAAGAVVAGGAVAPGGGVTAWKSFPRTSETSASTTDLSSTRRPVPPR